MHVARMTTLTDVRIRWSIFRFARLTTTSIVRSCCMDAAKVRLVVMRTALLVSVVQMSVLARGPVVTGLCCYVGVAEDHRC